MEITTDLTMANSFDNEKLSLHKFAENAYLNYSMYVIMDRALPFIGDGLKPVQRRIVYAMSELGLNAAAKYKKSARTVGDVLGKFHPHGDSACYEAMVLMAQPFSYRYPLIDGQGNWGAPDDPKSFAAMRYTESRLSGIADLLLSELGQGTVDYQPNFDGTLDEPKYLPARLPNILLNGTTGIAVGMATDIPPHNIREIGKALILLLNNPNTNIDDICKIIQAPDFPTKAEIITPRTDIAQIYRQGKGSLKMRAVWERENGEVIITALPHQTSGAKVIEQIAAQMRAKKIPFLEDVRDESDHENPTRIVLVPRSNRVDIDALMGHLFASTDLEKSYRINLNMLGLNGKPEVKSLYTILTEWLVFRRQTVTKRLNYRLDKINQRLHILEGLLTVYLNIDEVIDIIRNEEQPKQILMQRFNLSEIQANAILDLKLRNLAKLEEVKLTAERDELSKEQANLQKILASSSKLDNLIKDEITRDIKLYGDARLSPLVERAEAKILSENEVTAAEPVTVVLSNMGWVRCAKGHEFDVKGLSYKLNDAYLTHIYTKSNAPVVFLDNFGRSYALDAHQLPSARGHGEPLSSKFNFAANTAIVHMLAAVNEQHSILLASDAGYGFIAKFNDLVTKIKGGKAVINLPENAKLLPPLIIEDMEKRLVAISSSGRMAIYPVTELPQLAKGKGNQIISIPAANAKQGTELLLKLMLIDEDSSLIFYCGKRKIEIKANDMKKFYVSRGHRGYPLPRGLQGQTEIEIIPSTTIC